MTAYVQRPDAPGADKPLSVRKVGAGEVPFGALRGHLQDTNLDPLLSAQDGSPLADTANIGQDQAFASTEANFSVPAPEPQPAMLRQSASKIEARSRPNTDPERAAIDRTIADAKEEGFDPETGTHDLEDDIKMLREQEALTPEEEAALSAADETYQAATAWEKVMNVAQSCVLK